MFTSGLIPGEHYTRSFPAVRESHCFRLIAQPSRRKQDMQPEKPES